MAERKVKFVEKEVYHIYNRGNFRREIFHDQQDYERFLKILFLCNSTKKFKFKDLVKVKKSIYEQKRGEQLVDLLVYVLMPNHFHLMVSPKNEPDKRTDKNLNNNISIFMKRVTFSYTRYYNSKYKKTGNLFESVFKSEHIGDSEYYKYLFSYIHLNPIKLIQPRWREEGIKDFLKAQDYLSGYQYSSFIDFFNTLASQGGRNGKEKIVNKEEFLKRLPPGIDLNKEIFDWLKFKTIV